MLNRLQYLDTLPYKEYETLEIINEEEILNEFKNRIEGNELFDAEEETVSKFINDPIARNEKIQELKYYFDYDHEDFLRKIISKNYHIVIFNYLIDIINDTIKKRDNLINKVGFYKLINIVEEVSKSEFMSIDNYKDIKNLFYKKIKENS